MLRECGEVEGGTVHGVQEEGVGPPRRSHLRPLQPVDTPHVRHW